ncbi:hypothetical protein MRBLWO14_003146 [Microbacterium sp. LWO14-1.2]|uniref:hypothetical protein n=1 Tax=Microbacterium sp. LWO14-1.2 TaxID=3135263 RepID=UPI0031396A3E
MTEEEPSQWAEIVGPCYTVSSMARTLRWTEAEAMKAGNDLRLLMLHTEDDIYLFPSFQVQDGKIVEDRGKRPVDLGAVVERRIARKASAPKHLTAIRRTPRRGVAGSST